MDNAVEPGVVPPTWNLSVPVRIVAQEGNPGYAASCNAGARAATGDRLLFLNADVFLSSDCLERCEIALANHPRIGIVTCRLRRPDGSFITPAIEASRPRSPR